MPYMLRDVGMGCFMLVFRGEDVGAVFSSEDESTMPWTVTLHADKFRHATELPSPFEARTHQFSSLEEIVDWLGLGAEPSESAA